MDDLTASIPQYDAATGQGNWNPGRGGHVVQYIVCHHTDGSEAAALSRFRDPASVVSAHYIVCQDAHVDLLVEESDTAFHCGIYDPGDPTPGTTPGNPCANSNSIGIEFEGIDTFPDAQYAAGKTLISALMTKYGVPADHVIPHHAVVATACPGTLDLSLLTAALTITDRVAGVAVQGNVWEDSPWLDWGDLNSNPPAVTKIGSVAVAGTKVTWTDAVKIGTAWYDRIETPGGRPGAWALNDYDVDDGGFTPDHFRPVVPTPVPTPVPVPEPIYAGVGDGGMKIASGTDEASVVAAIDAWLDAHRGSGAALTKDGVVVQNFDPIPPIIPTPTPVPTPTPTPDPTPVIIPTQAAAPGGLIQLVWAILKWIGGHLSR